MATIPFYVLNIITDKLEGPFNSYDAAFMHARKIGWPDSEADRYIFTGNERGHAARLFAAVQDYEHNLEMASAEDEAYMPTDHGDYGLAKIAKCYGVKPEDIVEKHSNRCEANG